MKSCTAGAATAIAMPASRRCAKPGGAVLRRSTRKRALVTATAFTISARWSRTRSWPKFRPARCVRRRGANCRRKVFSNTACCTTSSAPITPIPRRGTRSASAARRARAAMCACISIGAIPGRRRKRGRAAKTRHDGRTPMSADAAEALRATAGRAPDVFRRGGWVPMRQYADDEAVDFAIVGTGAGGGTLACKLAEYGFSVVALDAGPYWRPLEDFASDEHHQAKLYWTDERIVDGDDPIQLGSNNSGKSVGGSTVHFAMVSLRFRPEWFKARTRLGYGADWPLDWREMWTYYAEVEQALKISGPVNYPWGPKRPRYPYRPHELNAAARALALGCEAMGIKWTETPLATLSAPRGRAHPCAYRG